MFYEQPPRPRFDLRPLLLLEVKEASFWRVDNYALFLMLCYNMT